MRFILAPDSFKGSLSAEEACSAMGEGLKVCGYSDIVSLPIADGGEGTVSFFRSLGWTERLCETFDPLGRAITAGYVVKDRSALIESAAASGLCLLSPKERNPLFTSSLGTGLQVKNAIENGASDITVTLGGSAINDAGTGFLAALGVVFRDAYGNIIKNEELCGATLERIYRIDMRNAENYLNNITFTAACDVDNPLYGKNGAAYVFAPQKGADSDAVKRLDNGLRFFSQSLLRSTGRDVSDRPGSGAAGGLGAALYLLGAKRVRGIDAVLDYSGFDAMLSDADAVLTGEGSVDVQSAMGKAISGVAVRAKKAGVPVVVFAGRVKPGAEKLKELGVTELMEITPPYQDEETAMRSAYSNLRNAVIRYMKFI